jgi:uncharacterized protein (TIGR02996 family)
MPVYAPGPAGTGVDSRAASGDGTLKRWNRTGAVMSDEKGLLAAIWEHPHDDTPRLVYADWLQENGQPERAEFIRVQCELARLDEWDESPRKAELEKREQSLWTKHAKAWKTGLPKLLQAAPFHRGFVSPRRRAVTGSQFLKLTLGELASAPLWDFNIGQVRKTIVRVVASEAMVRVGVLEIQAQQFLNQGAAVLSVANFHNVADLRLTANWIGESGVAALVANPSVRQLRKLELYSSDLTDAAIATLASAPWFPGLHSLEVGNNPFGEPGLHSLIGATGSGALRSLSIQGPTVSTPGKRFDDNALAALFGSPRLAELQDLDLTLNSIGDSGVDILCTPKTTFRPRRLRLGDNAITDRGAESLAGWSGLEQVTKLDLDSNELGARGVFALARSPYLTRIKAISLMFNPISEGPGADARTALVDRFGDAVRFKFRWET